MKLIPNTCCLCGKTKLFQNDRLIVNIDSQESFYLICKECYNRIILEEYNTDIFTKEYLEVIKICKK